MNTTKTIEKTSNVLGLRCEETAKNMDKMMKEAGCANYECADVTIPLAPGSRDDVVFVGLNGVGFYFMRGKNVKMPEPLLAILSSTGTL